MLSGFNAVYLYQVKNKPKEINTKNKVNYKIKKKQDKKKPHFVFQTVIYLQSNTCCLIQLL